MMESLQYFLVNSSTRYILQLYSIHGPLTLMNCHATALNGGNGIDANQMIRVSSGKESRSIRGPGQGGAVRRPSILTNGV